MGTSWAERAVRRRDARADRSEIRPPSGSKKDTKRWCRGVRGREHKPVWKPYVELKRVAWLKCGWKVLVCETCGRELDIKY